jgi:hypothetical protein
MQQQQVDVGAWGHKPAKMAGWQQCGLCGSEQKKSAQKD